MATNTQSDGEHGGLFAGRSLILDWLENTRSAARADGDAASASRLELEALRVLDAARSQIDREDVELTDALRGEPWGAERRAHLEAAHREQRVLLTHAREAVVESTGNANAIAKTLATVRDALARSFLEEDELVLSWGTISKATLGGT